MWIVTQVTAAVLSFDRDLDGCYIQWSPYICCFYLFSSLYLAAYLWLQRDRNYHYVSTIYCPVSVATDFPSRVMSHFETLFYSTHVPVFQQATAF